MIIDGKKIAREIIEELKTSYEVEDLGPYELNPEDDYPKYTLKVAKKVAENPESEGILICRSGIGVSIAANKVKGCYAALCFTKQHAEKAREHNNANVLCLDADYTGDDPLEITKTFLSTNFAGWDSRHGRRVKEVLDIEAGKL